MFLTRLVFFTDRKGTQASAILSTIGLMPTRSLLILVGYSVICYSAAGTHPFFLSFFFCATIYEIFLNPNTVRETISAVQQIIIAKLCLSFIWNLAQLIFRINFRITKVVVLLHGIEITTKIHTCQLGSHRPRIAFNT